MTPFAAVRGWLWFTWKFGLTAAVRYWRDGRKHGWMSHDEFRRFIEEEKIDTGEQHDDWEVTNKKRRPAVPNGEKITLHDILSFVADNVTLDGEWDIRASEVTITVTGNYINVETPGSHFSGSYHPNSICEGAGVCRWCGRVL